MCTNGLFVHILGKLFGVVSFRVRLLKSKQDDVWILLQNE